MPDFVKDFKSHSTSALITVKCFPWTHLDKLCLFGDAAHAIVPFFGQGMNAALEDCEIFSELVDKYLKQSSNKLDSIEWTKLFHEYERLRKPNTDAIADMAIENLTEMSEKTADPRFLFKKKVEHLLGNNFPEFRSRYEMVSFSNIPYCEAVRIGEINDKITAELSQGVTDVSQIDLKKAKQLIETFLSSKL